MYVSYTVVLRKPRLFSTLGLKIANDQFLVKGIATDGTAGGNITSSGTLGTSELNSIGSSISLHNINVNLVEYKVTLPASLSGGIEFIIVPDSAIAHTVLTQSRLLVASGNITAVNDLARGGTSTTDADPTSQVGTAEQTTLSKNVVGIAHFNVEMASQDVDNELMVRLYVQDPNATIDMLVMLRRYNTNEITTPPVFKTSAGDVIVASSI